MRVKEKFDNKLLVEGGDDMHVVWALCKKFKIKENFDVINCDGIDNLIPQIPIRFKQSQVKTIGIIIDADSDILTRWETLKKSFILNDIKIPKNIPKNGLILVTLGKIKVGIWIMPNNNNLGMLEDFISFLVPKNDALFKKAGETLNQIEVENLNNYLLIHKSKALINTWLAWQKDSGTPMGHAITKKYLDIEDENCKRFIDWIKNLFG